MLQQERLRLNYLELKAHYEYKNDFQEEAKKKYKWMFAEWMA